MDRDKVYGKGQGYNMANRFTVNGVTYTAKPFDFDLVCELEDMGVTFERIDSMPMSLIRGYFALCSNTDRATASSLIQNHITKGGNINDIIEPMAKEMNESDFFRALSERQTEESTESKSKAKKSSEE